MTLVHSARAIQKPASRCSRPPDIAIRVLESEVNAAQVRAEVEESVLFKTLCESKAIRKVRVGQFIPFREYSFHRARAVAQAIQQHGLESKPGWNRVCGGGRLDERDIRSLSLDWRVPLSELKRVVGYFRDSDAHETRSAASCGDMDLMSGAPSPLAYTDTTERVLCFVEEHDLSQQAFLEWFVAEGLTSSEIAKTLHCSEKRVEEVLEALRTARILDEGFAPGTVSADGFPASNQTSRPAKLVAKLRGNRAGQVQIDMLITPAGNRYVMDQERMTEWIAAHPQSEEVHRLVMKINALNQRSQYLSEVLSSVGTIQRDYILSGVETALHPLSQSEVARAVGCHRSVVCRMAADYAVETSQGVVPLKSLMPSMREVVARFVALYPSISDAEISEVIQSRLGVRVSRRLVNYHRTSSVCGRTGPAN